MANPALNVPVATVFNDQILQAGVLVTGTYTQAVVAANTIILTPNTLFGANTSLNPLVDVIQIAVQMGTVNGFVLLEYVSANTAAQANQVIGAFGKSASGLFPGVPNLLGANSSNGAIQVDCGGFGANETFTLFISVVKNNGQLAWANQYSGYPAT